MNTATSLFIKHRRLILFLLAIFIISLLLYVLRNAVLVFAFGLVLAYLFRPLISWAEKRLPPHDKWQQAKRVSLVILALILIFGLIGLVLYYVITALIAAVSVIIQNAPYYISKSLLTLQEWTEAIRQLLPSEIQQQLDKFLLDIGASISHAVQDISVRGVSLIPTTFHLVLGFVSLPIFLFYVLKDSEKLGKGFYSALPPWAAEHARNMTSIIELVLGRYIRAQLLLGFIVGYLCFIGLFILRVQFALELAILAAVTELIPLLGPWIGGAVAVVVTLATAPEKAVWVAVLYLSVQLLENHLLVPRIQGHYLHIHPAIMIVLLVLGAYAGGFWGIILIVPVTATIVELYKYVRRITEVGESQQLPLQ